MRLFKFHFSAMATPNEVQLYARDLEEARSQALLAIDEVLRIERKYSRYRDDSVTSRINGQAGKSALTLDDETAALIDYAAACHAQSDGLFDITSGVLRRAWNFKTARVPEAHEIDALLPLIGWSKVAWERPSLFLPVAGMELDFGGIGKEYAADRAAVTLRQAGVAHALINLGGDVRVVGARHDGSPWRVGIRHPRQPDGVLATIALAEGGLATSGDYERCFELDGERYSHILDPRTGWPVRGLQSVSVVAPLCIVAGSCATIAMLEGTAGGHLAHSGLAHLVVDKAGRVGGTLQNLPGPDRVC